jgi:hypothetical protein
VLVFQFVTNRFGFDENYDLAINLDGEVAVSSSYRQFRGNLAVFVVAEYIRQDVCQNQDCVRFVNVTCFRRL